MDLAWLAVIVVIALCLVLRAVAVWRAQQCLDRGHDWIADTTGYTCRRCKGRHDVGDFL